MLTNEIVEQTDIEALEVFCRQQILDAMISQSNLTRSIDLHEGPLPRVLAEVFEDVGNRFLDLSERVTQRWTP